MLNQEQFIELCKTKHNNFYDYSKTVYTGIFNKIIIICPKHGEFTQIAKVHKDGHRCTKCSNVYRKTQEEYIELCKTKHDNFYDYSKTKYKNSGSNIIIICPIHGEFTQNATNHLCGYGCKKCGNIVTGAAQMNNFEDMLNKSKIIHNNIYDYSLITEYKGIDSKIIIICPIHKEFETTFYLHINREQGCPACKRSRGEMKIERFLLDNNIQYVTQKKFTECKYIKQLPFDFYLPKYNICIEFDGEQHFGPIKFLHIDNKRFKLIKKKDKIKTKYCKNNNILLIRIPYLEKQNIEKILSEHLKTIKGRSV